MRLEEINDPNPKYINSVIIWGVKPIALLADAMITMQDDPDLIYLFGVMIQERCEDLEKCLLRLYGENQLVDVDQYRVDLIENAVLKENLIKKLAAMLGVDPEHVTHGRKYSVDDLQLMGDFFKFLHKGEPEHTERIKELLSLANTESPETAT